MTTETTKTSGTCQCCFNTQKLPKGMLSHHGYKAPGNGYHVGRCRGERALPFEVSCEMTKAWRAEVAAWLDGRRAYLAQLEAGEVVTLPYSLEDRSGPRRGYGAVYPRIHVTIKLGDESVYTFPGQHTGTGLPSWEYRLDYEIRTVKAEIAAGTEQVAFFDGKIAGWIKVW